MISTSNNFYK